MSAPEDALRSVMDLMDQTCKKWEAWETESIVEGSVTVDLADEIGALRTDLTAIAQMVHVLAQIMLNEFPPRE